MQSFVLGHYRVTVVGASVDWLRVMRYAAQPRGQLGRPLSPPIRVTSKTFPKRCWASPGASANLPKGSTEVSAPSQKPSSHSKHQKKETATGPGKRHDLTDVRISLREAKIVEGAVVDEQVELSLHHPKVCEVIDEELDRNSGGLGLASRAHRRSRSR